MKKKSIKFLGIVSFLSGIGLLFYVLYPIFSYEIVSSLKYPTYLSPVPEGQVYGAGKQDVDFTKASNWLPLKETNFDEASAKYYTLSIPSLDIKNATVSIGGEDLSKSLIQYPGTAYPGRRGNAVVFGHSVLPQFFNPEDYLTIFSTLPTIKKNDSIFIEHDGITYEYKVESSFEVLPTDIQILEQNTSDSFLTLVTCVPPGHPLRPKRLIVRARVVPFGERI